LSWYVGHILFDLLAILAVLQACVPQGAAVKIGAGLVFAVARRAREWQEHDGPENGHGGGGRAA
jgi:hypothetical protein